MLDSLIDNRYIRPVVVACSFENKKTIPGFKLAYRNAEYVEAIAKNDNTLAGLFENHYHYFINEFIPYIEKKAPVSTSSDGRVFYGTSNSADFGITLSLRNQGLIDEYWCYSPVYSNISDYGLLDSHTLYRICWGAKEEVGQFDGYQSYSDRDEFIPVLHEVVALFNQIGELTDGGYSAKIFENDGRIIVDVRLYTKEKTEA